MIKKEIYLVTSTVKGVSMDFDAYETKAEAVEAALTINKVAGNENACIQPINLLTRADDSAALRARVEALEEELRSMLYIFDRGLEPNMIGRKICDTARAVLEGE